MCAAAIAWDETLRMDASCSACGDAGRRMAWGCDRDAAKPTISLPCLHCDAEKPSATCEGCGGRGVIAWRRCPNRCAAEAAEVIIRSFTGQAQLPTQANHPSKPE